VDVSGLRCLVTGTASGIGEAVTSDSRWVNGTTLIADGGISGAVLAGLVPAPEI
jgi:hypothetical protein